MCITSMAEYNYRYPTYRRRDGKIENGGTVEIDSFVFGSEEVNGVVEVCGSDSEGNRSKARPWVDKSD